MAGPAASSEPVKLYETIKQSLHTLPHINLQEPLLTATEYLSPLPTPVTIKPAAQRNTFQTKGERVEQ